MVAALVAIPALAMALMAETVALLQVMAVELVAIPAAAMVLMAAMVQQQEQETVMAQVQQEQTVELTVEQERAQVTAQETAAMALEMEAVRELETAVAMVEARVAKQQR